MEHKYLIFTFAFSIFLLSSLCPAKTELPKETDAFLLIAPANPALASIDQLYVIIEPADKSSSIGSLSWKKLQLKVENKLKNAGIAIAQGIVLGKGQREHNIAELRVYMEMLKFSNSKQYVFRAQTVLASKAHLKEKNLYFKAEVWKSKPIMDIVSSEYMPDTVTNAIIEQVEEFIYAHKAANQKSSETKNERDTKTQTKKPDRQTNKQKEVNHAFVASKNSKVFHKQNCSSAERILPKNLVTFNDISQAVDTKRRPCKKCKP